MPLSSWWFAKTYRAEWILVIEITNPPSPTHHPTKEADAELCDYPSQHKEPFTANPWFLSLHPPPTTQANATPILSTTSNIVQIVQFLHSESTTLRVWKIIYSLNTWTKTTNFSNSQMIHNSEIEPIWTEHIDSERPSYAGGPSFFMAK